MRAAELEGIVFLEDRGRRVAPASGLLMIGKVAGQTHRCEP